MKVRIALCAAALLGAAAANTAVAMEQGDWLIRFGASNVDPKSDNNPLVSVDSAASATLNFSYMMTRHWSVEVLAAYPFEHDIEGVGDLAGLGKIARTKHLPPTVSLQYHFLPDSKFQPYIGGGVNYTNFFNEKGVGALEGADLKLDDSWGLAAEIGADFMLGDTWFLNVSVRYINIDTDATVNGDSNLVGEVSIDPWVYGAHVGLRF